MTLPLLAGALAVLPFLGVITHGFVSWDDASMIAANPLLTLSWRDALAGVFASFHMTSWQPLGWLLYKALHAAGGGAPEAFHAASLVLHGLNAALALLVLRELLPGARPAALLAGALAWAWHPVHAESVAWASQLSDLLCVAFVLASLLAHLRGRRGLAWGLAALAGLCRWKALAAPVFALALDLARGVKPRELARRHAGFIVVAAGVVAVNAAAKASAGYAAALRPHEAAVGLLVQFFKLGAPFDLAPVDLLDGADNPLGLGPVPAFLIIATFAWFAADDRRERPAPFWGLAAFVALLAPTLVFATPGPVAVMDHHLYAASLVIAPLAALLARDARPALTVVVLLVFAAASGLQTRHWRDSEALWARAIDKRPLTPAARLNLAAARAEEGRWPAALVAVDEQLAVFPGDPLAVRLRAEIFARAGAAPARLESDAAAWLLESGRAREAAARMERALSLAPDDPELLVNAAIVDGALGRRERARARLKAALKSSSRHARALEALRRLDAAEAR